MEDYYPEMHTNDPEDLVEIIGGLRSRIEELESQLALASDTIPALKDQVALLAGIVRWFGNKANWEVWESMDGEKHEWDFIGGDPLEIATQALSQLDDSYHPPKYCPNVHCQEEMTWGSDGWYCEYCGEYVSPDNPCNDNTPNRGIL